MASEILAGMLAQGAGSLIGAGASLWAQDREQKWSAEQAQINRDWESLEADKAREWNLDMWNLQNEYNDPRNQYNRLQQLGINDASIMQMMSGNGAAGNASNVATQSAPASAPAAGQGSVANRLGDYLAQIPQSGLELMKSKEDWYNQKMQNWILQNTKDEMVTLKGMEITEANARIKLLAEQAKTQEQETVFRRLQGEMQGLEKKQFEELMDWNIKQAKANYDLTRSQIDKNDVEMNFTLAQQGKIPFEIALLIAQEYYQREAGEHVGDKSLEQYLVGLFGPKIKEMLGLDGEGSSNSSSSDYKGPRIGKNGEIVADQTLFDAWMDFFNKVSTGEIGKRDSRNFMKEMNDLYQRFMSGKLSYEKYNIAVQRVCKHYGISPMSFVKADGIDDTK